MAKLAFTKLGLKPNNEIKTICFNQQTIEVKQYLSVEEKLQLITNVLQFSYDEHNFSNPVKVEAYTALEIIERYTNINFTEKQKENPVKLYDLIFGNGFLNLVYETIPERELQNLLDNVNETIASVYKYRNSILGVLESVSQDYNNLNLDASEIQNKLSDPENMTLLKEVMSKLG